MRGGRKIQQKEIEELPFHESEIIQMFKVKLRQFKTRELVRSSSEKERKVNALASGADEGRD